MNELIKIGSSGSQSKTGTYTVKSCLRLIRCSWSLCEFYSFTKHQRNIISNLVELITLTLSTSLLRPGELRSPKYHLFTRVTTPKPNGNTRDFPGNKRWTTKTNKLNVVNFFSLFFFRVLVNMYLIIWFGCW